MGMMLIMYSVCYFRLEWGGEGGGGGGGSATFVVNPKYDFRRGHEVHRVTCMSFQI